ncbi:hypothetical protein CH340_05130 [Rhodoplanes serenus]|nr:hypothetical protein CH340_05130 [Rhodoplanes serenus]
MQRTALYLINAETFAQDQRERTTRLCAPEKLAGQLDSLRFCRLVPCLLASQDFPELSGFAPEDEFHRPSASGGEE